MFYGTRTLLQLLRQSYAVPRGRALDWPRYPQRGLMIDLGRRIYPQRWIESHIRELAYLKLNLLHLHLTDDQRWGIASSSHPEVVSRRAEQGAGPPDPRACPPLPRHRRARDRHARPLRLGFPAHPDLELRTAAGTVPPQGPDSRKLDITNPAALRFVRHLLEEYLPLSPGPGGTWGRTSS